MKDYRLVIFDWDGTLMDSVQRIVNAMEAAAQVCGIAVPSDTEIKGIIGLSLERAIETLFPDSNDEILLQLSQAYQQCYLDFAHVPSPLFDNSISLLSRLAVEGRLLAVATGKKRTGLNKVLQSSNTRHFFNATRCASECISKPHPQMLKQLLDELEIGNEQAVMIGDSPLDLKMANAANIDAIAITHGAGNAEELQVHSPVHMVDDLYELEEVLFHVNLAR